MNTETWKTIIGYDGYQVSSEGRVRTLRYHRGSQVRILSPSTGPKKYDSVVLSKNGKQKTFLVHRLVALHFIGQPPEEKLVVDHCDGDIHNNCVSNLSYKTQKANLSNPITKEKFLESRKSPVTRQRISEGLKKHYKRLRWEKEQTKSLADVLAQMQLENEYRQGFLELVEGEDYWCTYNPDTNVFSIWTGYTKTDYKVGTSYESLYALSLDLINFSKTHSRTLDLIN